VYLHKIETLRNEENVIKHNFVGFSEKKNGIEEKAVSIKSHKIYDI
jgi:hypothetical protein